MQHALLIEFDATGIDGKALYEAVVEELGLGTSGLAVGAISHTAVMSETSVLTVFELWETREDQEVFMQLQLMPALQKHGAPAPSRVEWLDVYAHNHT
jgi:hypothetical protein